LPTPSRPHPRPLSRKRASGAVGRLIAIGDIHGYSSSLAALIEAIDPKPHDTLVPLGDYIDRGPDSRGALELLVALAGRCRLLPILGNHDELMLEVRAGDDEAFQDWLSFGGTTTLASYECDHPRAIAEEHIRFLEGCRSWVQTERHFFVHASYLPDLPLAEQPLDVLRWASLQNRVPPPHCSGKTAIVGHTAQKNHEVLDVGHLKCIDTHIYGGGWLTALEVESGQIWQVDAEGRLRSR
jgi:serine/threonine protein phosphatase 1